MLRIALTTFLLGLAFGWGPCLASCAPLVISYNVGRGKNIQESLVFYLLFSAARIFVYITAAVLFFLIGQIAAENLWGGLYKYGVFFGGGFIILAGLLMVIGQKNRFCQNLMKDIIVKDKKSMILFGLITGFAPCAPLIAILSYIMLVSKSGMESVFYSISFGIGTVLSPLILLVFLFGVLKQKNPDNRYARWLQIICALVIIFLGVRLIISAILLPV